ncbi:putative cytochrome b5-like heme/steroid binding domain superfamily [Helianthus annuus]|nr:putative cytochrome b5-like heme/steroid binding domain superfamily [Helianthus annuus]
MPTLTKLYSMQEASEHNSAGDCWIVVDGKVFTVKFVSDECEVVLAYKRV